MGGVLSPLARAASVLYAAEVGRRNRRSDRGIGVTRFDRPVISVGNLSVGGTGKTPIVRWLVGELVAAGHVPAIAMRGYASRDGLSDEAEEYRRAMPDVRVVAQPDRTAGLRALFATTDGGRVDCVVLDDGFQHRTLARDLDIVLIDATRRTLDDRVLPAGWLREPVTSLARADAVVLTRADRITAHALDQLAARVRDLAGTDLVVAAQHAWAGLRVAQGQADTDQPVTWLAGQRVVVCCAIGHPAAFVRAVRDAGAEVAAEHVLADHHPYDDRTVRQLVNSAGSSRADAIVVTEKDWVKLRSQWPADAMPVVRPRLEVAPLDGWADGWDRLRSRAVRAAGGGSG